MYTKTYDRNIDDTICDYINAKGVDNCNGDTVIVDNNKVEITVGRIPDDVIGVLNHGPFVSVRVTPVSAPHGSISYVWNMAINPDRSTEEKDTLEKQEKEYQAMFIESNKYTEIFRGLPIIFGPGAKTCRIEGLRTMILPSMLAKVVERGEFDEFVALSKRCQAYVSASNLYAETMGDNICKRVNMLLANEDIVINSDAYIKAGTTARCVSPLVHPITIEITNKDGITHTADIFTIPQLRRAADTEYDKLTEMRKEYLALHRPIMNMCVDAMG